MQMRSLEGRKKEEKGSWHMHSQPHNNAALLMFLIMEIWICIPAPERCILQIPLPTGHNAAPSQWLLLRVSSVITIHCFRKTAPVIVTVSVVKVSLFCINDIIYSFVADILKYSLYSFINPLLAIW